MLAHLRRKTVDFRMGFVLLVAAELAVPFLAEGRGVVAALRDALGASEDEVARNGKLIFAWDWLSLALCLGWDEGETPHVPLADGDGDGVGDSCDRN